MLKKSLIKQLSKIKSFHTQSNNFYFTTKLKCPPITHIKGEEYSRYACDLFLKCWINPYLDTSSWEQIDLSCQNRQLTNDSVVQDAIKSGLKTGSIFKEPILIPNEASRKELGVSCELVNPNAFFRNAWNGFTISRDTIHIKGLNLGYKNKVLFDRHAIGGEYSANWRHLGAGELVTTFTDLNNQTQVIDKRILKDKLNAVVCYHNPYDNIEIMARHFFSRCLEAKVTPFVVTKKTVFKWQEPFWKISSEIFNKEYKAAYNELGLLKDSRGELPHLLSDVATMRIVRWSNGGFGMMSLNYDGDVLTDEIAQVHRSRGFLTSILSGIRDDGTTLKEFEASHGTNSTLWAAKLRGKETSFNPLSLIEAMLGAIEYSVKLNPGRDDVILQFTNNLRKAVHRQMAEEGNGTWDISGPTGLNTEEFVIEVKKKLDFMESEGKIQREQNILFDSKRYDKVVLRDLFSKIDANKEGQIDFDGFKSLMKSLGVAPILKKKF